LPNDFLMSLTDSMFASIEAYKKMGVWVVRLSPTEENRSK